MNKNAQAANPTVDVTLPQERKERYERAAKQGLAPVYKRTIPPPKALDGNPGMSFIEVTESQIIPSENVRQAEDSKLVVSKDQKTSDQNTTLSWQLQRQERLFAILSTLR